MRVTWDIFCSVVDNYGDIGVTWRLARQLVAEHDVAVRLWVDDLQPFVRMCPEADLAALIQVQRDVEVRLWAQDWQAVEPADVVVEAFACELPAAYVAAMAGREHKVLWLNLEYLSAEDWVEGCHGLPSMQSGGLAKFFFFPGFSAGTGGLLRERDLLARRDAFQSDAKARVAFLHSLGVEPLAGARLISLFCYENTVLPRWLDVLAADTALTQLLVPEGRALASVMHWLGEEELKVGAVVCRGALQIHVVPFMSQDEYDLLLWCCDFNAVRGEDSFIRAQWAGRPLLWHIYQQDEGVHLDKLNAFLALYTHGLSTETQACLSRLWMAWNTGADVSEAWQQMQNATPELDQHAAKWALEQASRSDLAAALVQFYLNWL